MKTKQVWRAEVCEPDEVWFGEGLIVLENTKTGRTFCTTAVDPSEVFSLCEFLNSVYIPPHSEQCDVDPVTLEARRDISKGEIFSVCDDCRRAIAQQKGDR